MEIRAEVKATYEEISEYFHFDEVLNIRYYPKSRKIYTQNVS